MSTYDLAVMGGIVVDGSGLARRRGDVAVKDGKIAKINGTDVRLMVDSGAFFSIISPASAAELKLSTRSPFGFYVRGDNGDANASIAKVKEFTIPGVTLHDIEIRPDGKSGFDNLTLDVTAKTYRYLDEDELSAVDASKNKGVRK